MVKDAFTGGGHPSSQQRHLGLHFEELTVIHARAYQYQYIPCSNSNAFLSFNVQDAIEQFLMGWRKTMFNEEHFFFSLSIAIQDRAIDIVA